MCKISIIVYRKVNDNRLKAVQNTVRMLNSQKNSLGETLGTIAKITTTFVNKYSQWRGDTSQSATEIPFTKIGCLQICTRNWLKQLKMLGEQKRRWHHPICLLIESFSYSPLCWSEISRSRIFSSSSPLLHLDVSWF